MGSYIKFDLEKGVRENMPIVVRIEEYVEYDILKEIEKATKDKVKEYLAEDKHWNNDFDFVDSIMKPFADKYDFDYYIVFADINIFT